MKAAALAVEANLRDVPESVTGRFAIRFARNTFGWGGRGILVASRDGLRFMARRAGFLGYLRPRDMLFVPSNRIASVLREADVIRLHIRGAMDAEPANLEFAAQSDAFAGSIVEFLPVSQTVELEEPARSNQSSRSRGPRSWWPYAVAVVGAVLVAALVVQRQDRLGDVGLSKSMPILAPGPLVEPEVIPQRELVTSRAELRAADERTAALKKQFALELRSLMDGTISQADFDLTLKRGLIPQWQHESAELANRLERVSAEAAVIGRLNRSADLWERALMRYSEGLREQEPQKVLEAFELIGRAQALEVQAYDLVRGAEKRAASAADGQP